MSIFSCVAQFTLFGWNLNCTHFVVFASWPLPGNCRMSSNQILIRLLNGAYCSSHWRLTLFCWRLSQRRDTTKRRIAAMTTYCKNVIQNALTQTHHRHRAKNNNNHNSYIIIVIIIIIATNNFSAILSSFVSSIRRYAGERARTRTLDLIKDEIIKT